MPKNTSKYLNLEHLKELRVYDTVKPSKVLSMQDPYNYVSYNTTVSTLCKPVENKSLRVLENYKNYNKEDDYFLIEYKK